MTMTTIPLSLGSADEPMPPLRSVAAAEASRRRVHDAVHPRSGVPAFVEASVLHPLGVAVKRPDRLQ